MDLTKYFLNEMKLHPSLAPQDVVKLCFQGAFGAEHMLGDMNRAKEYFQVEYEATPADDRPLAEYIAPTVCRVNLAAWKRLKLNPNWLWNLFAYSATAPSGDSHVDVFDEYVAQADELCRVGEFPFSYSQWLEYIDAYRQAESATDCTDKPTTHSLISRPAPVRHSAEYREKETPAYRVVSGHHAMLLPIFEAMSGLDKGVIAIDGRAAAGKSTLSAILRDIIGYEFMEEDDYCHFHDVNNAGIVIKMDDFFLPPELRTAERLQQPGGNVHCERFVNEVLPYVKTGQGFKYRKYDCSRMEYSDALVEVQTHPWRIVEGVYSHHPALGDYMDVRVFVDIQPQEQQTRIKNRNTPEIATRYINEWIPMEEAYFKAYGTREAADVVIKPDK